MSSMEDRTAARQKQFKKGTDAEDARRKREDEAVQLRKNKKEELLQKRRCGNDLQGDMFAAPEKENEQMNLGQDLEPHVIQRMVQFCAHGNQDLQFEAAWVLTNIASGASE